MNHLHKIDNREWEKKCLNNLICRTQQVNWWFIEKWLFLLVENTSLIRFIQCSVQSKRNGIKMGWKGSQSAAEEVMPSVTSTDLEECVRYIGFEHVIELIPEHQAYCD